MELISFLIPALVAVMVGVAAGYAAARILDKSRGRSAKSEADEIIKTAKKEAETIKKEALLQAKDKLFQSRADLEHEIKERRAELSARESRLLKKEENLERKTSQLESKETALTKHEKEIDSGYKKAKEKELEVDKLVRKQLEKLEQLAGLSANEAKEMLLQKVERRDTDRKREDYKADRGRDAHPSRQESQGNHFYGRRTVCRGLRSRAHGFSREPAQRGDERANYRTRRP